VIAAIFNRGWVHPWRRPAEDRRSVRLGREPVRVVSPLPPYEPEALPDEPFAPVYDHRVPPLLAAGDLERAPSPRWPDALVFGASGAPLGGGPLGEGEFRYCRPCGVKWRGDPRCWACGCRA